MDVDIIFGKNNSKIIDYYITKKPHNEKLYNEYLKIKSRIGKYYKSIKSDKQIRTIIKLSHKQTLQYFNLMQILTSKVNIDDYDEVVNYILETKSDEDIYKYISKYNYSSKYKKTKEEFCCQYEKKTLRITIIVDIILSFNNNVNKIRYLDLGCGRGWKTIEIGKGLGLNNNEIYGADIQQWFGMDNKQKHKFNFIKLEENSVFPIKDKRFNIVTLLMVLHHIPNLHLYLSELNRIMEIGGLLYIREHDAFDDIDYMLIDIEHAMYEIENSTQYNNFKENYYARYFDWLELTILLKHYGFKKVYGNIVSDSIKTISTSTRNNHFVFYKEKDI